MKTLSLCFAFLLWAYHAAGQKLSIQGRILNTVTGQAVEGAEVMLAPGPYSDVTSKRGECEIKNIKKGRYILSVTGAGFKMLSQGMQLDSSITNLDFAMDTSLIELKPIIITPDADNSFGIGRLNAVEGTSI